MPFLLLASKSKVGKRPRASSSSSSQKLDDDDGPREEKRREEKRRDAFVSLVLRAFSTTTTTTTRGFLTKEEVETMMCLIYSLLCVGETTFVWPDQKEKHCPSSSKTHTERERERENEPKKRGGRHFFYFP